MTNTIKCLKIKDMKLDDKSQLILDEFVQSCLTLNIERVAKLFKDNPTLTKASIYDEMPFLERVNEIFDEFKVNSPVITGVDSTCSGCTPGGLTKKFNVTYQNRPALNSNFGFLINIEENKVTEIYECSQFRSYQFRLKKRIYKGMTDEQIKEFTEASNSLPDIF